MVFTGLAPGPPTEPGLNQPGKIRSPNVIVSLGKKLKMGITEKPK